MVKLNLMKKTLLIYILLSICSIKSFTQINVIEQNAAKWFKNVYVEEKFKDPYSYKLLKIKSKSETILDKVRIDVFEPNYKLLNLQFEFKNEIDTSYIHSNYEIYTKVLSTTKENSSDYETIKEKVELYKALYELSVSVKKLDTKIKNTITRYLISIDCYSNNSYGNKVLGRYSFYYYPKNSKFYKSDEKYSTDNFYIDESTIIDRMSTN